MAIKQSDIENHNKQQRSYYEGRGPEENHRIHPVETAYIERHLSRVISVARLSTTDRILEVGCGMGKYTLPLNSRGFSVEGLELSPVLLESLRLSSAENQEIPLHCADVLSCPAHLEGQFDVVLGFFMLHHLVDLDAAFEAMQHYLRPGGRAVFLEPNAYNPLYYLQITFSPSMRWAAEKGLLSMKKSMLFSSMHKCGFESCGLQRFGTFPPFFTNHPWGAAIEDLCDGMAHLHPFAAFQVFSGTKPLK